MRKIFLLFLALVAEVSPLSANSLGGYVEYRVNYKPLDHWPKLKKKYLLLRNQALSGRVSMSMINQNMDILSTALDKDQKWVDGLWMKASGKFQLALALDSEKKEAQVLRYLVEAEQLARDCLRIERGNPLCQLFLGSAIAHRGAVEGIFSALDKAYSVERLWLNVSRSKYNYRFTNHITMQGAVRYALGIFYRLVPDSHLIEFLYKVQGDMHKSVRLHRDSLSIDGKLPCSRLMLGVALICAGEEEEDPLMLKEGVKYLGLVGSSKRVYSLNSERCIKDSERIAAKTEDACAYSTAGQQEQE